MLRSSGVLLIKPLFYDALSGEFHPSSDPQKRAHTLARLAIATFEKGEFDESSKLYRYWPSWAPFVESMLSTLPMDKTQEIEGLSLQRYDLDRLTDNQPYMSLSLRNDGLFVADNTLHPSDTEPRIREYPLKLAEELDLTRTNIAHSAEDLFDLSE